MDSDKIFTRAMKRLRRELGMTQEDILAIVKHAVRISQRRGRKRK